MHRLLFIFFIALHLIAAGLDGQDKSRPVVCGISSSSNSQIIQRLEENKAHLRQDRVRFRSINFIPVKFHLVANGDGDGRVFF